ncbi:hypothetical protein ACLB2K_050435 [Fragaria x ananassa]
MFEHVGILCRHIWTVFTVKNALTLPSQYILKRWTRNAKSWVGVDEQISDPQAMIALRDSGKRIADMKKNVAKAAPPSSHDSGSIQEESIKNVPLAFGEMVPPLWPWQEALPHQFNLNDVGVPVTGINQPSMAGSIQPDGGHPDNTVVYTCFKSMTWVIENKNSTSAGKVAVINLKPDTSPDYGKNPAGETDVQFRVTLEPMLRLMAYIGQQLSAPANRVAVINLKGGLEVVIEKLLSFDAISAGKREIRTHITGWMGVHPFRVSDVKKMDFMQRFLGLRLSVLHCYSFVCYSLFFWLWFFFFREPCKLSFKSADLTIRRKWSWFSIVKKTLNPKPKEKKDQVSIAQDDLMLSHFE